MLVGPFSKTETSWSGPYTRSKVVTRTWYHSVPKKSQPCPYHFRRYTQGVSWLRNSNDAPNLIGYNLDTGQGWEEYRDKALQRAYDKFVSRAKANSAQIGTALAERHSTLSMIAKRAGQIGEAYQAIRKGNVNKFLKTFGITNRSVARRTEKIVARGRRKAKSAADIWLEVHFGWVPAVQDVYDGVKVLSEPPPYHPNGVFASSNVQIPEKKISDSDPFFTTRIFLEGSVRVRMGAEVIVTNPSAFLANQAGLVNPASIAWELTPFSFLVDWFGNVGSFLNSFTDFVGMEVKQAYTTTFTILNGRIESNRYTGSMTSGSYGSAVGVDRVLGITRPSLHFHIPSGLSVTRAATAISLAIQQFLR